MHRKIVVDLMKEHIIKSFETNVNIKRVQNIW